uniref:Uncharacterized protein n=1 Tax=Ascaris lumbricoides TaxID=6252 RepID=A0A9J2PBI4_ASCLU
MDVIDYSSVDSVTSVACRDNLGRPFPGFIPLERTCEKLVDLNLHPCDHRTSSCVVLSLPNSHILVGCVDDHSGKFVAPKNWYIKNSTLDSSYLFDFKVRNPLRLTQKCRVMHTTGRPICMRNNIFYRRTPLVQQVTCCCKGDFCADALFDQAGFNPLPYLHISLEFNVFESSSNISRVVETRQHEQMVMASARSLLLESNIYCQISLFLFKVYLYFELSVVILK